MAETDFPVIKGRDRGNWIRLRTMILLRWGAVCGQFTALMVAGEVYHLQLAYGLCFFVVGISVIGNLVAQVIFPENKRLSEAENLLMVMFDLVQLAVLLYLTGGLHNPFSILIVGPVTVSAAALSARSSMFVGSSAIVICTLLTQFYLPLQTEAGAILRMADVFVFGNWLAIVIAVIFMGIYSRWIATEMHAMSDALQATQMALAREQKLTDLGGVVAAAAHELGTPLATIKLASAELAEELDDRPELKEDALLIRGQADRCRDILRSMGRAGKDDPHLRHAPLTAVVEEAAEPHMNRGKRIRFETATGTPEAEAPPAILRRPEVIHGLRNLVQNAVDFARADVWIETGWNDRMISVRIMDDGRGYPPNIFGRIGDPFVRRRRAHLDRSARPEYEGMGLGLFIAKTLLERTGAELSFANGHDRTDPPSDQAERQGAIVAVTWPRRVIAAQDAADRAALGENRPIAV
ncbi:sensor histidine kinase RegB [Pseudooceanicola aestuarii]|uniref:sensor histidine kinase RegB n=1 Tax=Pseudooceanicola aestuarii TaxID=2697319 RepID=UPI0013D6BA22|nr:ActS/PrrB/RegB family redox-sensitive histidine kinase [Pseudooceanicola aestuarii]